MKLTGTNSQTLQTIRQPTRLQESNSLVFIYPFIIDKSLDAKYGLLLRDFFTTQFTAQIKISNVLNITSSAARHSVINQDIKKMENPAELSAQSDALGLLTNRPKEQNQYDYQYYNQIQKHEYQEKINQFKQFIYDQVMTDPRFSDVNPLISDITVENLINIPLIIGTKSSAIAPIPLFWILFFATGQGNEGSSGTEKMNFDGIEETFSKSIRMDRPQSFEFIKRFIKEVAGPNYRNYEQYLGRVMDIPAKSNPSNRISSLMHNIDTEIDRAIKVFIRATNERMYSDEIGFSQNSAVSISNAYMSSMDSGAASQIKAQNLYTSYVANYLVPILQSVATAFINNNEMVISDLIRDVTNISIDLFMNTYKSLDLQIQQTLVERLNESSTDTSITQLANVEKMCHANAQLGVVQILAQLKTLGYDISSSRASLIRFVETGTKIAAQLATYKKGLLTNLESLSLNSTKAKDDIKKIDPDNALYNIFYSKFIKAIITSKNQAGELKLNHSQRIWDIIKTPIGGQAPPNRGPVDSEEDLDPEFRLFINQITRILGDISSFMAFYVFFSYLCEHLGEIKAKVDIQKKDALDFPNYCLVFKKEVVEALYGALASTNYKNQADKAEYEEAQARNNAPGIYNTVKKNYILQTNKVRALLKKPLIKDKPAPGASNFTDFKINETDIMQMIRVLNSRLNIPNIIVVDEKSNTIYYKWMYSGSSVGKLTMTTVQNYVQHQKQIL